MIFILVMPLVALLVTILYRVDDAQLYRVLISNIFDQAPVIADSLRPMIPSESATTDQGVSGSETEEAVQAIVKALPKSDLKDQLDRQADVFSSWMAASSPGDGFDLVVSLATLKEQGVDIANDLRITTTDVPHRVNLASEPVEQPRTHVISLPNLMIYHHVFHSVRSAATIILGVLAGILLPLIILLANPPVIRSVRWVGLNFIFASAVGLAITAAFSLAPSVQSVVDLQSEMIFSVLQPALMYLVVPMYLFGGAALALGVCMLVYGFIHREHRASGHVVHSS